MGLPGLPPLPCARGSAPVRARDDRGAVASAWTVEGAASSAPSFTCANRFERRPLGKLPSGTGRLPVPPEALRAPFHFQQCRRGGTGDPPVPLGNLPSETRGSAKSFLVSLLRNLPVHPCRRHQGQQN